MDDLEKAPQKIRIPVDKINNNRQASAIIPNVIHSLDASHLHSIILKAKKDGFNDIISIHDCFGTNPNKMADLQHRIRKAFILQYANGDYLSKFRDRIVQSIQDNNINILVKEGKQYAEIVNKYKEIELLLIPKAPI